jgi:glucokinase
MPATSVTSWSSSTGSRVLAAATAVWRQSRPGRGSTALAAMIASVGAVCDLDVVVVGGGVARSGATLFDPLREALAGYTGLDFIRGLRVVPAALGGDAGLIGAAALFAADG